MSDFSAATAIAAEGNRIGIVSCERCGAAILLDSREKVDRMAQHFVWHDRGRIDYGPQFGEEE